MGTMQDKLVVSSVSQERVAVHLCSLYSGLDLQQKSQFLFQLADNYRIDQDNDRKERDNLNRTQKFLDKTTCDHCDFLVCHDCVTDRKRGTKYKNMGGMTKPCRTRTLI